MPAQGVPVVGRLHQMRRLAMASLMDMTVLVVAADGADTRAPAALRDAIEQAGGHCAGLVFNRSQIEAPGFLKALLP